MENEYTEENNKLIDLSILEAEVRKNYEETKYLKELFKRRLEVDKQKQGLINNLESLSQNAYINPFLQEIILVLDRLEKSDNEFSQSISGEIFDIFSVRGLERIEVDKEFNPEVARAVKKNESSEATTVTITEVVRTGYKFNNQVIRPIEVVVEVPNK